MIRLALITILMATQTDPRDMTAYVRDIKASRMSEVAKSDLTRIASVIVGETTYAFRHDEQRDAYWGPVYTPAQCPRLGMSESEVSAWRQELDQRRAPVIERLLKYADTDRSGFVSTAEAADARRTFEFGLKVAFIKTSETAVTEKRLMTLTNTEPAEFRTLRRRYEQLAQSVSGLPGTRITALSEPGH